MFPKAAEHLTEQGILSSPSTKPRRALHPAAADAVKEFYCSDENSTAMPNNNKTLQFEVSGINSRRKRRDSF
jgi:hypothetical protein